MWNQPNHKLFVIFCIQTYDISKAVNCTIIVRSLIVIKQYVGWYIVYFHDIGCEGGRLPMFYHVFLQGMHISFIFTCFWREKCCMWYKIVVQAENSASAVTPCAYLIFLRNIDSDMCKPLMIRWFRSHIFLVLLLIVRGAALSWGLFHLL